MFTITSPSDTQSTPSELTSMTTGSSPNVEAGVPATPFGQLVSTRAVFPMMPRSSPAPITH
jgi:hypothetical protein